jgi:hypothetical protein
MQSETMKLYFVTHSHKYGISSYVIMAYKTPPMSWVKDVFLGEDFDPSDDYVEIAEFSEAHTYPDRKLVPIVLKE